MERNKLMIKIWGRVWSGHTDNTKISRLECKSAPSLLGGEQVCIPSLEGATLCANTAGFASAYL